MFVTFAVSKLLTSILTSFPHLWRDRSKDTAKKAKEKLIKDWMRHHKGFVDTMGQYCLEIECKRSWGPDDKFDAKFVKQMLKDYDLELDGFTAGDLLRVWRKY